MNLTTAPDSMYSKNRNQLAASNGLNEGRGRIHDNEVADRVNSCGDIFAVIRILI